MLHDRSRPCQARRIAVEDVPFDAVNSLRTAWFAEDFPDWQFGDHLAEGRDVAGILGAQVLAVMDRLSGAAARGRHRRERRRAGAQRAGRGHPVHGCGAAGSPAYRRRSCLSGYS
jgi:hypothetical protein